MYLMPQSLALGSMSMSMSMSMSITRMVKRLIISGVLNPIYLFIFS